MQSMIDNDNINVLRKQKEITHDGIIPGKLMATMEDMNHIPREYKETWANDY
jgi:hypothetical protein